MAAGDGSGDGSQEAARNAAAEHDRALRETQVEVAMNLAGPLLDDTKKGEYWIGKKPPFDQVRAYIQSKNPDEVLAASRVIHSSLKNEKKVKVFVAALLKSIDEKLNRAAPVPSPAKVEPTSSAKPAPDADSSAGAGQDASAFLDKGKDAKKETPEDVEFKRLQDAFTAKIGERAKVDKGFNRAANKKGVAELWLKAKRSGLDPSKHPFFTRRTDDVAAFGAFADSLDVSDQKRYVAAAKAGKSWKPKFMGKHPEAALEKTIDDDLVTQMLQKMSRYAESDEKFRALGEVGAKEKIKPLVERVVKGERPTDDELKEVAGNLGGIKDLLLILSRVEKERRDLKEAYKVAHGGDQAKTVAGPDTVVLDAAVVDPIDSLDVAPAPAAPTAEELRLAAEEKELKDKQTENFWKFNSDLSKVKSREEAEALLVRVQESKSKDEIDQNGFDHLADVIKNTHEDKSKIEMGYVERKIDTIQNLDDLNNLLNALVLEKDTRPWPILEKDKQRILDLIAAKKAVIEAASPAPEASSVASTSAVPVETAPSFVQTIAEARAQKESERVSSTFVSPAGAATIADILARGVTTSLDRDALLASAATEAEAKVEYSRLMDQWNALTDEHVAASSEEEKRAAEQKLVEFAPEMWAFLHKFPAVEDDVEFVKDVATMAEQRSVQIQKEKDQNASKDELSSERRALMKEANDKIWAALNEDPNTAFLSDDEKAPLVQAYLHNEADPTDKMQDAAALLDFLSPFDKRLAEIKKELESREPPELAPLIDSDASVGAPPAPEAEPAPLSLGEVADKEEFWHKTWFKNNQPNIRRDVVDQAILSVKHGKDVNKVVDELSSVKKTRDQLKEALIKLAALEPDASIDTEAPESVRAQFEQLLAERKDAIRVYQGLLRKGDPSALRGAAAVVADVASQLVRLEEEYASLRDLGGVNFDFISGDVAHYREIALGGGLVPSPALDSAPTNTDVLKTPEDLRVEVEKDIASATTAAETEAYFDKIEGLKIIGIDKEELAKIEKAANEKWNKLMIADVNKNFIDRLNLTNTVEEARALSSTIEQLKTTWSFNDAFETDLVESFNLKIANLELPSNPSFQPLPAFDAAPSVAPLSPIDTLPAPLPKVDTGRTPEQEAKAEVAKAKVNKMIDKATSRDELYDTQELINNYYDDGTLTLFEADDLTIPLKTKWDAVATPKEKAQDQVGELDREIKIITRELRRSFSGTVDAGKVNELLTQLVNGEIDVDQLKVDGVLGGWVIEGDFKALLVGYNKAWDAKEIAQADVEAAEKAERPGLFARIGGWFKGKPKAEAAPEVAPVAPIAPAGEASVFSPDNIKAADLMSSDFWKYLGDQALERFKAYRKGELTESERKGEKQALGWTVARTGLEVLGSVYGARVITEQMRYSHTNKEYDRLLEAMGSAVAREKDTSGADVDASMAVIEDRIKQALEASNHLSDAKKAELQPRLVVAMEKVRLARLFNNEEMAELQDEQGRQVALLLDEALQLKVKDLSRRREAVNSAIALATLGTSQLASGALNVGLRLGRTGFMMFAGNVERMAKLQYERVQGGNLDELSKTQLAKDAVVGVVRGFKENWALIKGGSKENWKGLAEKGRRLESVRNIAGNWGLASLTILKYYGISQAFATDAPGSEHAEVALKAAENNTTDVEVPDASAMSAGGGAEQADIDAVAPPSPDVSGAPEALPVTGDATQAADADIVSAVAVNETAVALPEGESLIIKDFETLKATASVSEWNPDAADNVMHSTASGIFAGQLEKMLPEKLHALFPDQDFERMSDAAKHAWAINEGGKIAAQDGIGWLEKSDKALVLVEDANHELHGRFVDLAHPDVALTPEQVSGLTMEPVHHAAPEVDEGDYATAESSANEGDVSGAPVETGGANAEAGASEVAPAEAGGVAGAAGVAPTSVETTGSDNGGGQELTIGNKVIHPPEGSYSEADLGRLAEHAKELEHQQEASGKIWRAFGEHMKDKGIDPQSDASVKMYQAWSHFMEKEERNLGMFLSKMENGDPSVLSSPLLGSMAEKELNKHILDQIDAQILAERIKGAASQTDWKAFERAFMRKAE